MNSVGVTTTIPLEVPLAANIKVIDLNNSFISSPDKQHLVEMAESAGFPNNTCCWIKGIYGAVKKSGIKSVIAVTEGDCSNTHALMEVLQDEGIRVIPFAYPYNRSPKLLNDQIDTLIDAFGTTRQKVDEIKRYLDSIREKVWEIDRLSWTDNKVTGWENHFFQVSCSDMDTDPNNYKCKIDTFLEEAKTRQHLPEKIRLGYLGVPPVFPEIYGFLESLGARVVYNEIQRQFSMPDAQNLTLTDQYLKYTYPYDIFTRLRDISTQIKKRNIHGLIHYTQAFCFRQIEDIIIRKHLKLPVLTIEGDAPLPLDNRTKLRLESFIESLQAKVR